MAAAQLRPEVLVSCSSLSLELKAFVLLSEIWLAKMQTGNLGFSTLVSFLLVVFCGFIFLGLGVWVFSPPKEENLETAFFK